MAHMNQAANAMNWLDVFSVISNSISAVLGVVAIWLSWAFYRETKSTEMQVTSSLAKIETQTQALQKLSAKWLDRLTDYITTERSNPLDQSMPQIIEVLTQLPQIVLTSVRQPTSDQSRDDLVRQLLQAYIALYYYTALTNYWTQTHLPDRDEFRPDVPFHTLLMRIVDSSSSDFSQVAKTLAQADQSILTNLPNVAVLEETRDLWRHEVQSTKEVYAARAAARAKEQAHPSSASS